MSTYTKNLKVFLITIFLLFKFNYTSIAQTSKDFVVHAHVVVNKRPPSITIKWPLLSNVVNYKIYRKSKAETTWGTPKAITSGKDTMWTDMYVNIGIEYEYYIEKINTDLTTGYTYILSGIEVPVIHNRGNVLVVVEKSLADSITVELNSYFKDLAADGWNVFSIAVSKFDSIQTVRRSIQVQNAQIGGIRSLVILGHVPVPYSGNFAADGHIDHSGVWPTDAYYAIDYDHWSDEITKVKGITRPENQNLPNDSKWDNSTLPGMVKYQTGRIDLSNMSKFSKTEAGLTKQYIKKAHDFRYKITQTVEKGVIDDNFPYNYGSFGSTGWRDFDVMFGPKNVYDQDYLTACRHENVLFGYGAGGGTYQNCAGVGTTDSFVVTKGAVFNMLFGSYFGDWDNANNLLRAPLASAENGLTVAWSGRPYWENFPMALGKTIGYCARKTQNNRGTYRDNVYGNTIPIGLMGDPTLRLHIIAPPTNVKAKILSNFTKITLDWSPSAEPAITGYYIYRSNNPFKNYTLINSIPITDTNFIDNSPNSDTNYYFVKTLKLTTTASGSYFNLSQGAEVVSIEYGETIKPTVFTKNKTIYLNSSGEAFIASSDIDNGSFDSSGIASMRVSPASFNCSNIGENIVTLIVTDVNNNVNSNTAIVYIIDTLKAIAIAKNIIVTLSGGIISIPPENIDNGSYDNCGIASMTASPSTFNCTNIGNNILILTITDNSGNISTAIAIVTITGSIPKVSISQNEQPEFYQGGYIVLKTTVNEPVNYLWNNSATTSAINVSASANYSVTVTNINGCKALANTTVYYDASSLLSSYSILVSGEAILRNTTTVNSGNVGSTASSGKVEANTNSLIIASESFVKSKSIVVATGGKITNAYSGSPVQVNLPIFKTNPHCSSTNNINVKRNTQITLHDSIFGTITIERGAIVTFTSPIIYANKITTSSKSRLIFNTCSKIILCSTMIIEDNNSINAENKSIVFYSLSAIRISKGTNFNASVYTKDKLESLGAKNERINISGIIIAQNQYSDYTNFKWYTGLCNCGTINKTSLFDDEQTVNTDNSIESEIIAYPNPTNGITMLRIKGNNIGVAKIKIASITGETLFTTEKNIVSEFYEISLDLTNYTSGIYFVTTEYADKIKTIRLNKVDK